MCMHCGPGILAATCAPLSNTESFCKFMQEFEEKVVLEKPVAGGEDAIVKVLQRTGSAQSAVQHLLLSGTVRCLHCRTSS